MKLQYKIIVIPIVVMVSIFIIGMVVVENHLKSTLQERFQQEMHTLSTFALSSVRLLTVKKKLNANDNPFDKLADRIASASASASYNAPDYLCKGALGPGLAINHNSNAEA